MAEPTRSAFERYPADDPIHDFPSVMAVLVHGDSDATSRLRSLSPIPRRLPTSHGTLPMPSPQSSPEFTLRAPSSPVSSAAPDSVVPWRLLGWAVVLAVGLLAFLATWGASVVGWVALGVSVVGLVQFVREFAREPMVDPEYRNGRFDPSA